MPEDRPPDTPQMRGSMSNGRRVCGESSQLTPSIPRRLGRRCAQMPRSRYRSAAATRPAGREAWWESEAGVAAPNAPCHSAEVEMRGRSATDDQDGPGGARQMRDDLSIAEKIAMIAVRSGCRCLPSAHIHTAPISHVDTLISALDLRPRCAHVSAPRSEAGDAAPSVCGCGDADADAEASLRIPRRLSRFCLALLAVRRPAQARARHRKVAHRSVVPWDA
jgi:hypothetical protein